MEIVEAINARRSTRGFRSDPVPQLVLKEILEIAGRSPSANNTQPWECAVLTGDVLDRIRQANVDQLWSKDPSNTEHPYSDWPRESVYRNRQVELAIQIFQLMGIAKEDKEKRDQWMERGVRFFDAPAAIILFMDKALSEPGTLLDIGAYMQTLCLAALSRGLGTCIADQGLLSPATIKKCAGIPDSKRLIISISIGYPNDADRANRLETTRVPGDEFITWCGFE
jgi:nitroreductase